jgi:RNA polymerase sigma factor (sigma-70 family)
MSPKSELTQESFDELLSWLDANAKVAEQKYLTLHRGLTKVLRYWGCLEAEDMADETINRVARKVRVLKEEYKGNPERYFYGVAKRVCQEHQRKAKQSTPLTNALQQIQSSEPADELPYECLEKCLQKLKPQQREIVGRYYRNHAPDEREKLAKHLGTVVNTLRVRVFRIVNDLRKCVDKCMERGPQ